MSSVDGIEVILSAESGERHSTRPSVCWTKGSHVRVLHDASVTISDVEPGNVRLMPPTLSCSPPLVRYRYTPGGGSRESSLRFPDGSPWR